MTRREPWWLVFALPGLVASCNAVWGVDDLTYGGTPGEGGADTTSTHTTSTHTTSTDTTSTDTGSDGGSGGSGGSAQLDCTPGIDQDVGDCELCGNLIEHCNDGGTWDPAACQGQGVCANGTTDTSGCGACEQRACTAACAWDACATIAGCCADSCEGALCGGYDVCGGKCHAANADPCPDVPAETWRCVWIDSFSTWGSQVCRNNKWVSFHLNPRDCDHCCGAYSSNCCQASGC